MPRRKLILGDCLEVMKSLPDNSVDAVITDPPYGLGKSSLEWKSKGYKRVSESWDGSVPTAWFSEAFRLLKPGGSLLCFGAWKTFEEVLIAEKSTGFTRRGIVVWDKCNTMPNITARGYQYTHEFILWSTKGGCYFWGSKRQQRDIIRKTWSQSLGREHPTQKTIPLMVDLVSRHCPPGGVVLDPFMGSGTTGVAVINLGMDFIGIEIDLGYFEVATRRIKAAKRDYDRRLVK